MAAAGAFPRPERRDSRQAPWLTAKRPGPVPRKAAPQRVHAHPQSGAGWMSGLDGLRAVAVLAVLLFHADLGLFPGGFLGVDVFFVISGFLITTLLLREQGMTGRIDVVAFWRRRARRLLPALYLVLAGVVVVSVAAVPDAVARLRTDVLAALAYVTNWYLVFDHQSYFEAIGRPSLLRHLWSLAVEEQFYLLWPIVLAVALVVVRRRGALVLTVLIAAASVAWTAILFDPDGDPSRVYYGTDTRLFGLLTGAALAFAWSSRLLGPRRAGGPAGSRIHWTDAVAVAGLVTLAWAVWAVDEYDPALYPWGSLAVALVTAAVIAAVTHPAGRMGRVLDVAPLRWIGRRSYGIYLWHWPVFVLTRPGLDLSMPPAATLALRVSATLVLAALSYRFVEVPIRRGAVGSARLRLGTAMGGTAWSRAGVLASGAALLIVVVTVSAGVIGARPGDSSAILPAASFQSIVSAAAPSEAAPSVAPSAITAASGPPAGRPVSSAAPPVSSRESARPAPSAPASGPPVTGSIPSSPAPVAAGSPGASVPPVSATVPGSTAAAPPPGVVSGRSAPPSPTSPPPDPGSSAVPSDPAPTPASVPPAPAASLVPTTAPARTVAPSAPPPLTRATAYAIGDSVMLGAAAQLGDALGRVEVDAVVGRQMSTALAILQDRRDANRLPGVVVVHLGGNGPVTVRQVNTLFDLLADVQHVLVLTIRIHEDYETHNNRLLTQIARDHANVTVVDWHAASEGRPELFWNDGEHLRPEGARVYAALIASALRDQGVSIP